MISKNDLSPLLWEATVSAAYNININKTKPSITAADLDYVIQQYVSPSHPVLVENKNLKKDLFNFFILNVLKKQGLKADECTKLLLALAIEIPDGYIYYGGRRSVLGAALERGNTNALIEIFQLMPVRSSLLTHTAFIDVIQVPDEGKLTWYGTQATKNQNKQSTLADYLLRDNQYYFNDSYPDNLAVGFGLLMYTQKRFGQGLKEYPGSLINIAAKLKLLNQLLPKFHLDNFLNNASTIDGLDWKAIPGTTRVDFEKILPDAFKKLVN